MSRITLLSLEDVPPGSKAEWENQITINGRMTNMKKTLARSPLAFETYMRWYPLRDEVQEFLGQRLTLLFSYAVSSEADCLICSTFFRRHLLDSGEDPNNLVLNDKEELITTFGRQITKDAHGVSDELFAKVENYLSHDQIVSLVAFAGLMLATNIINNTLKVDLDEYLEDYK